MGKLIALSDGHGVNTSGKRTPIFTDGTKSELGLNYMNENLFNRAVVKYLDEHLRRCGFRTLLVAPTDEDTSLETRTNLANKNNVDLYVAIHANANNGQWGSWGGTETYIYPSGESKRIGHIIHKHLMKGTPLRDRGVKDGSHLWEIRKPIAPSILIESAFMDNLEEAKLLLSDAFRRECAREIAMGICEGFGVKYVAEPTPVSAPTNPAPTELYRVRLHWSDAKTQKGAYANLDSAKALADSLVKEGDYRVFNSAGQVVYDPTPVKDDGVWYRVRKDWADAKSQIGAFHELESAKELVDSKPNEGYEVYDESGKVLYPVAVVTPQPTTPVVEQLYRVRLTWEDVKSQIGAFKEKDSAVALADSRAKEGYKVFDVNGSIVHTPTIKEEPVIVEPTPTPEPTPVPQPIPTPEPIPVDPHLGHHDITGQAEVSAEKMVAFAKTVNPNAQNIDAIAKAFVEIGNKYNVRGDIAFCQSLIETGWFKFDGGTAVTPDQHNYCGMGVTSKGMKGNSFTTVEEGVTAQIQHLFAYATKNAIPNGEFVVDPRFKYVTRGIAPHWEDLSNRWAMNANYGTHILEMYEKLVAFNYVPPVIVEEPPVVKPTPTPEVPEPTNPVEQPEQTPDEMEKQFYLWKRIVDYVFRKIAEFFGKK